MDITKNDRAFYTAAIDFVTENLEIVNNFVALNGLSGSLGQDLSDVVIIGIKKWLTSPEGEGWLGTLGYKRSGKPEKTYLDRVCPVCSGIHMRYANVRCERCGRYMCHPCTSVVDSRYHIIWCDHCIADVALINFPSSIREY